MKILRIRRMEDKIRFVCAAAVLLSMLFWVATIFFAAVSHAADKGPKFPNLVGGPKFPNINLAGEWIREAKSEDGKTTRIVYIFFPSGKTEGKVRAVINAGGDITISQFKYVVIDVGDDILLIFYNNNDSWGAWITMGSDDSFSLKEVKENINPKELPEILIYKRVSY